ncbi:MAG: hypothetical protein JJ992_22615, partial [Planctomycetes bacterium]|nr:hypothetical protein [Planctomycetota bacterium]
MLETGLTASDLLPDADGNPEQSFTYAEEDQDPILFLNNGDEIWAYTVVLDANTGIIREDEVQQRGIWEHGVQETNESGALLYLDNNGDTTTTNTGVPSYVTDFQNGLPLYLRKVGDLIVKTTVEADAIGIVLPQQPGVGKVKSFVAATDPETTPGALLWLDQAGNRIDFKPNPAVHREEVNGVPTVTFAPRPFLVSVNRTQAMPVQITETIATSISGNDTLKIVDTGEVATLTGSLTATTLQVQAFDAEGNRITGGFGSDGLIELAGIDSFDITLGPGNDTFTVHDTPAAAITLFAGDGDDTITIEKVSGRFTVDAGIGDDIIDVAWSGVGGTPTGAMLTLKLATGADQVNLTGMTASGAVATTIDFGSSDSEADLVYFPGSEAADRFQIADASGDIQVSAIIDSQNAPTLTLVGGTRSDGDTLLIESLGGNDEINAGGASRTVDLFAMHFIAGEGNDRLIGSYFDDILDGGFGDDTYTGHAGTDVFIDAGGNDTLVEDQDIDMSLFGDKFVAGMIVGDSGTGSLFDGLTLPAESNEFQGETELLMLTDRGDVYAATYVDPVSLAVRNVQLEQTNGIFETASLQGGPSNNVLVVGDQDNMITAAETQVPVTDWTGDVTLDNRGNDSSQPLTNADVNQKEYYILN